MPQTINGIGTTYYGKKNLETEIAACESCGYQGEMLSYETGYYFVFLYIPLIPLGRKQVLDFCPACSHHRVMPVEEWKALKQQVIEQSTTKLAANMENADAAIEHLQTLTAFHQIDEARQLTSAIEGTHGGDVDVQLFLGSWHDLYGDRQDADRCFEQAFKLDPNHPGCLRAHGIGLIEKGEVDQAKATLQPLEPPSQDYDPAVFFMLASAFQEKNDHAGAMEIFEMISNTTPQFGREKWFRQAVRHSEKMLGQSSGQSILPRQSIFKSKLAWAAAIAAVLLISALVWNWYIANNTTVYIVNGNSFPIEFAIDDGELIKIRSMGRASITIPEGSHSVTILKPTKLAEKSFTFKRGWFQRFLFNKTYVLDPTETSLVYVQTATYVRKPALPNVPDQYEYLPAQVFHELSGIHYEFDELPHEIDMETKTLKKKRVAFFESAPEVLMAEQLTISIEEKDKIFRRRVELQPDDILFLAQFSRFSSMYKRERQFVEFLNERRKVRPVEIQIHRAYQREMTRNYVKNEAVLEKEYDELLAKESQNPDLLYLRGRLADTTDQINEYSDRALKIDPDHLYSLFAKAYCHLTRGEFSEGKTLMERVKKSQADNTMFNELYRDIVLAVGTPKEIDKANGRYRSRSPNEFLQGYVQNSEALMARGKVAEAKQRYDRARGSFDLYKDEISRVVAMVHWAVLNRDEAKCVVPKNSVSPQYYDFFEFQLNLRTDSRKSLAALNRFLPTVPPQTHLQVLIAAALKLEGHDKQAEEIINSLKRATKFYEAEEVQLLQLLKECTQREILAEEVKKYSVSINVKRCYALAILVFSKSYQDEFLKFAQKINYDYAFPHHFIEDSIKKVIEKRAR